jgi:NADH-quinone oxidoreductase subunit B
MQQFNEPNLITTSSDKLFNWARKNSLWPLQFGLACCAIEIMSTGMAHNDLDRFGAGFFAASPRQADVMIVSGTVSTKMAERMTRLYEHKGSGVLPDAGGQMGEGRLPSRYALVLDREPDLAPA